MRKQKPCKLIDLPDGKVPLPVKWVFKVKTKSDGSVEKFKARLVVKGFKQEEGIDYHETFSQVILKESFRAILAILVQLQLEVHQLDVKTVFLYGDLDEELYVD